MEKGDLHKMNQLIEMISAVASLDFSKKITDLKGDSSALDTIAIGLNMLSEELEDSVVGRDVLEAKNKELQDALSKMDEFKFALDASSIVSITNPKGVLTYVNDKFCELSQFTREELIGKTHRIINSSYHNAEFWKKMWETISSGNIWSDEIKNMAKDGSYYWVNTTIVPFVGGNGKPSQYMTIRQDITLRKEVEKRVMNSIISSQEKDRELFAEDLHEGIAQSLAALMLQVGIIETKIKFIEDVTLKSSVAFIKNYIQESIENTRELASDIMPRTMMRFGLEPSLKAYVSKLQQKRPRYIELSCNLNKDLEKEAEITLYRTLVAIINKVSLSESPNMKINLFDEGGFTALVEVQCDKSSSDKFTIETAGLLPYRKRVELYGGQLIFQKFRDEKVIITIKF